MANIAFPSSVLKPIQRFLRKEEKKLETRKKEIEKEDPFADSSRLIGDPASDADAAEQFGHARTEAVRTEINRRLVGIRKALTRIKIGRYGICESCGKMIDTDRLMVKPDAALCISCEKRKEK